ncbi:MAG TPA: AAA family ATPase, partial [Phycisphaerales bacterium]|nr:AAA family ATPase [Phycisphaerales bacterium]
MNPRSVPIKRLSLRQYKSIEHCDFDLGPLTVLVGRNGVGKSNILDALSFVTDALRNTLEYALRSRGGIAQVRRKSASKPTTPGISLEITLPDGSEATYAFGISTVQGATFKVRNEECVVRKAGGS